MSGEEVVYNPPADTCERCGAVVGLGTLRIYVGDEFCGGELEVCPACETELRELEGSVT